MNNFQCLGFEPTPTEKHVGIMTVRIHGAVVMVVRYKVVAKKDGSGFFPTVASYKMPNRIGGEEYEECFMLDSRSDNDAMNKFIMSNFMQWQKTQHPQQNVFNGIPSTPFIQRDEASPIPEEGELPF